MSIVILVGGDSQNGNPEHRYLVNAFLDRFGDQVTRIITCDPVKRTFSQRLRRMIKRGNFLERIARYRFKGGYGPSSDDVLNRLRPDESNPTMPGGNRCSHVISHNSAECQAILEDESPDIIVVYGTRIIRSHIYKCARIMCLNMHTGLSPFYRGDSTLFWPVFYDDREKLGVTVHQLVDEVDGGAIAATANVTYTPGDTEADLFAKGVKAGSEIYLQAVSEALEGKLKLKPQDLSAGREFRWMDRTVSAEHKVKKQLAVWAAAR